ncbi:hypothetical protein Cgig2_027040 [Carnegiea gigantea]|uniref:ATP synthase delta chain, chloroplastic n=1 Tax=Carnegiea gigantea TaxID=171969 RepID=A0A9Q1K921_9CARY|nr:hypothetical protein Cgig2_027040 [Carnegiea gigantea]
MAALQSPVALHSRASASLSSSSFKTLARKSFSFSFSSFKPLRLPRLSSAATKLSTKRRAGVRCAMMVDPAATNYATALIDVAKSNDTLEATSADIEKIDKIFSDDEVYEFFTIPVIDMEKKRSVLDDIIQSSGFQPHTANFLNILLDMQRMELIRDIVSEFEVEYNKVTNTELAIVSSVVKLENEHLAQIAKGIQRLTGAKNVRIKTVIDPSLVAGFTIRYGSGGSKVIDMSVKKQLAEIAETLELDDVQLTV